MPYIPENERQAIKDGCVPVTAGQLNYQIHLLLEEYVNTNGENYQTYNDILGALEGVKLELYRRRVSNYEDQKIAENGDIQFYQPHIGLPL